MMALPGVTVIGDRLNPDGFSQTRALMEAADFAGLQELAVRQVQSGARYLDLTVGPRGYNDAAFLTEVIRAVQAAVDVPLCFDYPSAAVQEVCLRAYNAAQARGRRPLLNSLSVTRMDMLDLLKIQPFQLVLMTTERVEAGAVKPNKHAGDVLDLVKGVTTGLRRAHGFDLSDVFVDVTIQSLVSDTEGRIRMTLEAIRAIRQEPDLEGVHLLGGLSNIGNLLPPLKIDGVPLRLLFENAFLTVAVPLGFDTIMGTPWNDFRFLPDDHLVLQAFRDFVELTGIDALRRLRQVWAGRRGPGCVRVSQ
jgi:cobalamin-dependent methionine synthase I